MRPRVVSATPDEFRHFVDRCHQRGVGVILDWVPGHFPKDAHGLAEFDGTDLYEHSDPRQGEHVDWGTLIFNYGRNEVRNFLVANGLFWFDRYHIDGLRVDAVASMLYLDYSRKAGEWGAQRLRRARELGGDLFSETLQRGRLRGVPGSDDHRGRIHELARRQPADVPGRPRLRLQVEHGLDERQPAPTWRSTRRSGNITRARSRSRSCTRSASISSSCLATTRWFTARSRCSPRCPATEWQQFANVRMFLAWMWAHPGKKLIFQGIEIGQWEEWKYARSLDWHLLQQGKHDGLRRLVQHLNWLYRHEPAFYEIDDSYEGFEWIDFNDADNSVISFARKSRAGDLSSFSWSTRRRWCARTTASARRHRASTGKSSTPMRRPMAAATSATAAGWTRRRSLGKAARTRWVCACRR